MCLHVLNVLLYTYVNLQYEPIGMYLYNINAYILVDMLTYVDMHIHVHMHTGAQALMHACIDVWMYVPTHVRMYLFMYVLVYAGFSTAKCYLWTTMSRVSQEMLMHGVSDDQDFSMNEFVESYNSLQACLPEACLSCWIFKETCSLLGLYTTDRQILNVGVATTPLSILTSIYWLTSSTFVLGVKLKRNLVLQRLNLPFYSYIFYVTFYMSNKHVRHLWHLSSYRCRPMHIRSETTGKERDAQHLCLLHCTGDSNKSTNPNKSSPVENSPPISQRLCPPKKNPNWNMTLSTHFFC